VLFFQLVFIRKIYLVKYFFGHVFYLRTEYFRFITTTDWNNTSNSPRLSTTLITDNFVVVEFGGADIIIDYGTLPYRHHLPLRHPTLRFADNQVLSYYS
jgi:hypothetical protein